MSFATFISDVKQVKRLIVGALYTIGAPIAVYHLFAFKGDKFGIYYRDNDQYWLAVGVTMLVIGWIIRNWDSK